MFFRVFFFIFLVGVLNSVGLKSKIIDETIYYENGEYTKEIYSMSVFNSTQGMVKMNTTKTPTCLSSSHSLSLFDEFTLNTEAWEDFRPWNVILDVSGRDYAYVSGKKVFVVDISNPVTPFFVSNYSNGYIANENIEMDENYQVFIGHKAPYGFSIVDVSDPFNPTQLGTHTYPNDENTRDIRVLGTTAFIATTNGNDPIVRIFDVSTPSNPQQLSVIEIEGITASIDVLDNYLYVAANDASYFVQNGLRIFDISNPSSPTELVFLQMNNGERNQAIQVIGENAYIISDKSFHVLDVSTKTNPIIIGSCEAEGHDLQVIGNKVYIAAFYKGLSVINISDKSKPLIVGEQYLGNRNLGLAVLEKSNHIFTCLDTKGMHSVTESLDETTIVLSGICEYGSYEVEVEGCDVDDCLKDSFLLTVECQNLKCNKTDVPDSICSKCLSEDLSPNNTLVIAVSIIAVILLFVLISIITVIVVFVLSFSYVMYQKSLPKQSKSKKKQLAQEKEKEKEKTEAKKQVSKKGTKI